MAQTHSQTAQKQIQPETTLQQTAPPCQPDQQQRLWQPPDGQAGSKNQPQSTGKCPLQPLGGLNEPPKTPFSTAIVSMIRNNWTMCNDNIKQISGVCSSWLRGKDPSKTLAAFQSLWCLKNLAPVTSPSGVVEDQLELQLHLSATCPVL